MATLSQEKKAEEMAGIKTVGWQLNPSTLMAHASAEKIEQILMYCNSALRKAFRL